MFALTDQGTVARPGEVGELIVRGPTVMPGYWGLPERTAKALVKNPVQPAYGEPAYLTGDYVHLREDGNYDFIGRRDNRSSHAAIASSWARLSRSSIGTMVCARRLSSRFPIRKSAPV